MANNARMEARTVISTSLDTTLSDGTSSINRNYINSICEKLLEILRPIVERILAVAMALNGDVKIEAMSNWELGFSASLKLFLSSALSLKMDLVNSGLAHSFIWPAHGEKLDVKTMCPAYSTGDNETVALVTSPGLAYTLGQGIADGMHQILVTAEVFSHICLE
ncbi:hypothetical protein Slin15195_G042240 [Septoria linicola]|uniref:Uncharacterized protein n=1 Tax=Septoria linicola TaxID=215465 RepID=A0A9Q9AQW0_9PEZI|nr:hypothetical protein Slin15195_G042240 [Septoria linicola]